MCLGNAGCVATPQVYKPSSMSAWYRGKISDVYNFDMKEGGSHRDGIFFGLCKRAAMEKIWKKDAKNAQKMVGGSGETNRGAFARTPRVVT